MSSTEALQLNARSISRAYAYSCLGWGGFALLMGLQDFILMRSYKADAPFLISFVVPIVRATSGAVLTPPLYFAVVKWPFSVKRFGLSVLRYLGLAAAFIVAFCCIRWVLFPGWDQMHMRWVPRSLDSLFGFALGGFANQLFLFLLMVIVAHAWSFHRQSQIQSMQQINLQRELAELQLQLLQMQLHPHFIFNTLHGITTLMERDVETARTMLLHLADLLRAAIAAQSQDLIPLQQELNFMFSYVALERMRLGSKLEVSFDIEPQVNDALVPYMILQPIVENAILHGAAGSRDGGWVKVACRVEEKTVFVEVSNNRVTVAAPRRDGLGLKNTRARLKNLFEQEASLEFTVSDGVAQARIQLPFITAREVVAP